VTTYSAAERLAAIQKQGFPDPTTALGISLAEFGVGRDINAQAQSDVFYQPGQNPSYPQGGREQSFGPWQIHLPAHPDVTQSCAMDLTCSTAAAYKISNGGTNFNPWSTFTNGAYKTALADIEKTLSLPTSSGGASLDPGVSGSSPTAAASAGASSSKAIPLVTGIVNIGTSSSILWRVAFVAAGIAAVWVGGRMYLHNDQPAAVPGVTRG
jgi:Lysozyme like domain